MIFAAQTLTMILLQPVPLLCELLRVDNARFGSVARQDGMPIDCEAFRAESKARRLPARAHALRRRTVIVSPPLTTD
ncbi:MAG: hypothetical protein KDB23_16495 [Planctomycetales bacterium]|nr:hypothetical protein [Planctomycetales bacterium]